MKGLFFTTKEEEYKKRLSELGKENIELKEKIRKAQSIFFLVIIFFIFGQDFLYNTRWYFVYIAFLIYAIHIIGYKGEETEAILKEKKRF